MAEEKKVEYVQLAYINVNVSRKTGKEYLKCNLVSDQDTFALCVAKGIANFHRFDDGGISVSVSSEKLAAVTTA